MKTRYLFIYLFFIPLFAFSSVVVKKIDFLSEKGLKYNGLGPLLVRMDSVRNRIIQVNTISSSLTIIDENTGRVINIPVKKRVPQFLKEEALSIDPVSGNVYSIADRSINIIFPGSARSMTIDTKYQFEMVAVDSLSGNCLLTGKTTGKIAYVNVSTGKIKFHKLFNIKEKFINLNQTPPPPLRKVVFDTMLKKFILFDGYTGSLYTLDRKSLKINSKREPDIKHGKRLHFAGYDTDKHFLYLVVETSKREDVQAVRLDCNGKNDQVIELPGLTEAVGVKLNSADEQVYIPYDNHPAVHIVDFSNGKLSKVTLPSYGNDASAFDRSLKKLFIASWAYGEIYVVDLNKQKLVNRIRNLRILPHMFNMAYSPGKKNLYIPLGATAVNGSFGSALTVLNVDNYNTKKILTGWAPVDIVGLKGGKSFFVFNSEDEFVKISESGDQEFIKLPVLYPTNAVLAKNGNVFLSYGPHQSYWPDVYIWGAKDGILEIDKKNLQVYDRRISRLAQRIVVDKRGGLWGTQNSWGRENIFLTFFPDGIRQFSPQKKIYFYKKIERENSPRILKYDKKDDLLFLVKTGEKDTEPGLFMIINPADCKLVASIKTGPFPTDLTFNEKSVYIVNFDSDSMTVIDRKDFSSKTVMSGKNPLKTVINGGYLYTINHGENSLTKNGKKIESYQIPFIGKPDNIASLGKNIFITSHNRDSFCFVKFNTESKIFEKIIEFDYPYGDTSFDSTNSAFYQKGQFADSVYEISKIVFGGDGKIRITDFLSGRLFIVNLN